MKITLYHLQNSRSQRIVWLLEELNLNYEIGDCSVLMDIPESLKPLKYPTVRIALPDQVIWLSETNAICEFLCEITDTLLPTATSLNEVAKAFFWKSHIEATFMHNMALKQVFSHIDRTAPFIIRPITLGLKMAVNHFHTNEFLKNQFKLIESTLDNQQWICGDKLTYLDIMIWFPLMAATANIDCTLYPNIKRYLDDLSVRPEYMKAMRVGEWDQNVFNRYWG